MKNILPVVIKPRLFALLALGFIIATIVGTVSHEAGHYLAAKYFGLEPKLTYGAVFPQSSNREDMAVLDSLYKADEKKIMAKEDSPEKTYFLKFRESLAPKIKLDAQQRFWFTFWGPVETMITGSIGFLLLWLNRDKRLSTELPLRVWICVYLCFFWSRQVFNFLSWIGTYIFTGHISAGGDEVKLSRYLSSAGDNATVLQLGWFGFVTAVIAAVILLWATFTIVPKQQRFSFIIAGIVGSLSGFAIWFKWLGPVILPV